MSSVSHVRTGSCIQQQQQEQHRNLYVTHGYCTTMKNAATITFWPKKSAGCYSTRPLFRQQVSVWKLFACFLIVQYCFNDVIQDQCLAVSMIATEDCGEYAKADYRPLLDCGALPKHSSVNCDDLERNSQQRSLNSFQAASVAEKCCSKQIKKVVSMLCISAVALTPPLLCIFDNCNWPGILTIILLIILLVVLSLE